MKIEVSQSGDRVVVETTEGEGSYHMVEALTAIAKAIQDKAISTVGQTAAVSAAVAGVKSDAS